MTTAAPKKLSLAEQETLVMRLIETRGPLYIRALLSAAGGAITYAEAAYLLNSLEERGHIVSFRDPGTAQGSFPGLRMWRPQNENDSVTQGDGK